MGVSVSIFEARNGASMLSNWGTPSRYKYAKFYSAKNRPGQKHSRKLGSSKLTSDNNTLDLVQTDLITAPIVELRSAHGCVIGHLSRDLQ